MPRKSKIEQLGIGDKIVGYSISGMEAPEIIHRIALEHAGVKLTQKNISTYLQRRSLDIAKEKAVSRNNEITFTLDSVMKNILETVGEIKQYLDKFSDNPRAAPQLLKVKVDALDKMVRMLGGYAPESQINVQVNVETKSLADQLKEYEAYFQSLES
jgi:hypothetical protein